MSAPPDSAAQEAPAAAPGPAEWRAAMGRFPTGVTIVTSWLGAAPVGTTVNAFCSVSLNPPLLLVCLDYANPALPAIEASGRIGVNFLPAGADDLARLFGRPVSDDRFADIGYDVEGEGAPHLHAALSFIDCVLEQTHPAGDHKIIVARGLAIRGDAGQAPLLYHRGTFPSPFDPDAWL